MASARWTEKTVPNPDGEKPVLGRVMLKAELTDEDLATIFRCGDQDDALFEDLFGRCLLLNSEKADVMARLFRVLEENESTQFTAQPEGGNEPDPEL